MPIIDDTLYCQCTMTHLNPTHPLLNCINCSCNSYITFHSKVGLIQSKKKRKHHCILNWRNRVNYRYTEDFVSIFHGKHLSFTLWNAALGFKPHSYFLARRITWSKWQPTCPLLDLYCKSIFGTRCHHITQHKLGFTHPICLSCLVRLAGEPILRLQKFFFSSYSTFFCLFGRLNHSWHEPFVKHTKNKMLFTSLWT